MPHPQIEIIRQATFQQYLNDHENDDLTRLVMSSAPDGIDHKLVAEQIASKRKSKTKLPHWYETTGIIFPPALSLEQCSSPATAHYKQTLIAGEVLVDLTGGMGVDTLALSHNFEQTTHIEQNEWLSAVFEHNAALLSDKNIKAVNDTAESYLEKQEGKASYYIDPARRDQANRKVFLFEDCSPDVTALMPLFKAKAKQVLIKAAPMIDISEGIRSLEQIAAIHVVSLQNECKEVLFLLDFENEVPDEPEVSCVNITHENTQQFSFSYSKEKELQSTFAHAKKYLYDPNASIRKAGAFKSIGAAYGLEKIAINTHLYTSDIFIEDFPGRVFEVKESLHKKNIKKLITSSQINVMVRNYPATTADIKKKYKWKDGGAQFVICLRDQDNKAVMLLCDRVK